MLTLMSVSHTGASAGLNKTFPIATSPTELSEQLQRTEEILKSSNNASDWMPVIQSLKKLRETIKYSMPHVGKIGSSSEYQTYAANVSTLTELVGNSEAKDDNITTLQKKITELTGSTKRIAQQVIVS